MAQPTAERGVRYSLLAMWIWPRASIREAWRRDQPAAILTLAAFGGMFVTLTLLTFRAPGAPLVVHPIALAVIGAVAGIGGLYVCGALVALVAEGMGSTATRRELRSTLALLTLPITSVVALVAGPYATWVGLNTLMGSASGVVWGMRQVELAVVLIVLSPFGIWAFFVVVSAMAEVLRVDVGRAFLSVAIVGGIVACAAIALADVLDRRMPSSVTPTADMAPTIHQWDRFLIAPAEHLSRGDIAVFVLRRNHPHFGVKTTRFIGRVIGVAGDTVGMTAGLFSVNGEAIQRQPAPGDAGNYLETLPGGSTYTVRGSATNRTFDDMRVGPGEVFVAGDNRDNHYAVSSDQWGKPDQATAGLIRLDRVIGKVARR
jgi:signal peptidase I